MGKSQRREVAEFEERLLELQHKTCVGKRSSNYRSESECMCMCTRPRHGEDLAAPLHPFFLDPLSDATVAESVNQSGVNKQNLG